ncbi:hypothetical protein GPECTOR_26g533 [Gonium pectorale]|uniref:Molybdenum cofactor sulfurase n=1 Tax=Gonium pectorale TaxID=33097 RepID=A0A150GGY3_GONPE|nr:hypothetical protein GPECTOR_26g533 [Gonium pectorale]|eukprot:KXZ48630.1 hypothetical protein GPECTOR_26g533 [Gonium pectorale]
MRCYGEDYGYGGQLARIRRTEFLRLNGQAYLDYAGAALYSERQVRDCAEELTSQLLCNPHSSPAASPSAEALAALRRDTLQLLNADGRQYEVVITGGATAALKMVAECFPWSPGSSLLAHPPAVHNSVLGMRGPALAAGAAVQLVTLGAQKAAEPPIAAAEEEEGRCAWAGDGPSDVRGGSQVISRLGPPFRAGADFDGAGGRGDADGGVPHHLLVLPAECNFTGDREPLGEVVQHVRQHGIPLLRQDAASGGAAAAAGRWLVLLDAAKACATAPPDLSAVPADFVVLSYYKIFGHPTGLGALVLRRELLPLLAARKAYWGGGTVEVAVADRPYQVRRQGPAGLEDGTPPFTAVAAARHGFAFLDRLGGPPAVRRHAAALARWLAGRLAALRHANGAPVAVLYGRWCRTAARPGTSCGGGGAAAGDHGPTVAFNLLRPDGSWVGYGEVGRLAAMHGLHLRTGCFCNPGACAQWLGLGGDDMIRNHSAGHVCWDDNDLVDGRPTGAVRASLGAVSSFEDAYALLRLVTRYFMDGGEGCVGEPRRAQPAEAEGQVGSLNAISADAAAAWKAAAGGTLASRPAGPGTQAAAAAAAAMPGSAWGEPPEPVAEAEDGKELAAAAVAAAARAAARTVRGSFAAASAYDTTASAITAAASRGAGTELPPLPSVLGAIQSAPASAPAAAATAPTPIAAAAASTALPPVPAGAGTLRGIRLYPVKSCAAQEVAAWPVGPTGLLFDREWALVDDGGRVLTLKHCPRMALIRPTVDLAGGTLSIAAPPAAGVPPLELRIPRLDASGHAAAVSGAADGASPSTSSSSAAAAEPVQSVQSVRLDAGLAVERVQVCGDTVCSDVVDACHDTDGEDRVRRWFARVLGAPCRIVQQRPGARKVRRPAGQAATRGSAAAAVGEQHQQQRQQQRSREDATASESPCSGSPVSADGDGSAVAERSSVGRGEVQGGGARKEEDEDDGGASGARHEPTVGFANDGQYLLVSEESMEDLRTRLAAVPGAASASASASLAGGAGGSSNFGCGPDGGGAAGGGDDLLCRLRPNLVVCGFPAYAEDGWAGVAVGPLAADVLGSCPRCELLQVDPKAGVRERGSQVLLALAQYRRQGGRVQFGVLLAAAAPAATAGRSAAAGTGNDLAVAVALAAAPQGQDGAGAEADGGGSEEGEEEDPGSCSWLRRRFGRAAVLVVGDPVVPAAPAAAPAPAALRCKLAPDAPPGAPAAGT